MRLRPFTLAAILTLTTGSSWAQITVQASQTDNVLIPDYNTVNLNAISETINLNGTGIQSVTSVQVSLDLASGDNGLPFNGDYYAYLTHGNGFAVLLNRVGITEASNPDDFGASDFGFDITLRDGAFDIHNYQNTTYNLYGDGQLTGTWAPDGRNSDPFTVQAADPRTALLDSFDGAGADGAWTLVIADASQGSFGVLQDWSLQLSGTGTTASVPDDAPTWELLFGIGLTLVLCRRLCVRAHDL
jgi:hypothetical protein